MFVRKVSIGFATLVLFSCNNEDNDVTTPDTPPLPPAPPSQSDILRDTIIAESGGMGEGGERFGMAGEGRVFAAGFDAESSDASLRPDVQPLTSPAVVNVAYQDVMLWNGQFGNAVDGIVNADLDDSILATSGNPKAQNSLQLSGVETQAVAGKGVHRLKTSDDSILQTNSEYVALFEAAFPDGSEDHTVDAAKAIAAFERTILANEAPFQEWLKGDDSAMNSDEIAGVTLFFGKAGCGSCHTGPGLSSKAGASEDEMCFAIGFADFDPNHPQITGSVDAASSKGRGGFTREEADNYKFKVPQLYNLTETSIFGHGASFTSVREVVAYKNAAVSQKSLPASTFDPRFVSLGLTDEEIDQITTFLETGLYDHNLERYVPTSLPSGNCFPVNDSIAKADLGC